jgi:pimeloyl-ACP methyl ester carboxylesterase
MARRRSLIEEPSCRFSRRALAEFILRKPATAFLLLVIPGGGLNATIAGLMDGSHPFDPMAEFRDEYRCIAADLRTANDGGSSGPLEADRPWDAFTDDHLGLMDHLGIDRFMVLGFCIGGPFIWNLLKRAPDRDVAGVLSHPSGSRPELRDPFFDKNMKGWGPAFAARRPRSARRDEDRRLGRAGLAAVHHRVPARRR